MEFQIGFLILILQFPYFFTSRRLWVVLQRNLLQKCLVNAVVPEWSLMKQLSVLSMIGLLICGNGESWVLNLDLTSKTVWTGVENRLLISMLGNSLFDLIDLITLLLLM